ncbi:hypothetical protein, conserved, containing DUF434 domain [Thermococcus kodakarensis KOD1]|uniref:DUF434 domain-containing protein n=1 Tax=Thermococcus kodakarensis (strain ATCC BAA-918 / JCM 12380 / KOD1) TaxID=69014 RepID=Q5JDK5_THEKO|nr:DUF434 domain-containing protein [Thermococcus kodakarensis]WCN27830.1 DUF434 domain-containing protein [Thermococcus kodakarensis]WCN30128.1 DUF434 domain-containing protein [Thermococcus kodakarensis]BAD86132.1 hypothetical protein, conserved, containing DUF434 domain [Thermococcus kodakarensis KOD1]
MSLTDAYRDLRYLLNRGYPKKSALKFVADHYRLSLRDRYLLARCVFSDAWIAEVRRKLLKPGELEGKVLAVDGFNVLITLESVLDGEAILCEDGLVRDLKYQGKYRLNERTREVVEIVVESLSRLKVSKAIFFYGKNVPKSGIVRKITEEAIEKYGLSGDVRLVKSPDFELKAFSIVATADVGIISRVEHVFDVPLHVSGRLGVEIRNIFDIFQVEKR